MHGYRWLKSAGDQPTTRQRTIGSALGSGFSNLVTGTIAAPFLYANPARRFSYRRLRARPRSHLKKIYGRKALRTGLVVAGVSMLGGGIREAVQSTYESGLKKAAADGLASMASGHSGDLLRVSAPVSAPKGAGDAVRSLDEMRASEMVRRRTSGRRLISSDNQVGKIARDGEDTAEEEVGPPPSIAERQEARRRYGTALERFARSRNIKTAGQFGIMAYQRDPREMPESKRPPAPKGRIARMFGTRMHAGHARHRLAQREEEEWMKENGEFIEIGNRPGIRRCMRDVAGVEDGQVLSRADVAKMVAERRHAKARAFGRRSEKKKAKEHVHPHSPEDMVEVYKTFEQLLDNPAYRFFQVG